jgi:hypothetical protein
MQDEYKRYEGEIRTYEESDTSSIDRMPVHSQARFNEHSQEARQITESAFV